MRQLQPFGLRRDEHFAVFYFFRQKLSAVLGQFAVPVQIEKSDLYAARQRKDGQLCPEALKVHGIEFLIHK